MNTNWRKRWFILHDDFIYYYKAQNDMEPVGVLFIPDYVRTTKDDQCKKSPHCWRLVAQKVSISAPIHPDDEQIEPRPRPTRDFVAFCSDEDELNSWLLAMNARHVVITRPPTPPVDSFEGITLTADISPVGIKVSSLDTKFCELADIWKRLSMLPFQRKSC